MKVFAFVYHVGADQKSLFRLFIVTLSVVTECGLVA